MEVEVKVMVDAPAALGIIAPRGIGKARHLDTSHLWIQEAAVGWAVQFQEVHGSQNPVVPMTKELGLHTYKSTLISLAHSSTKVVRP